MRQELGSSWMWFITILTPHIALLSNYLCRLITTVCMTTGSFQDGSGCGNETASEKEMYRKYMIDSLTYWAEEFGVDGFRFDLMGLHDVATMNAIRSAMDDIDPRILRDGEGWDMGIGLPVDQKGKKDNAALTPSNRIFQ